MREQFISHSHKSKCPETTFFKISNTNNYSMKSVLNGKLSQMENLVEQLENIEVIGPENYEDKLKLAMKNKEINKRKKGETFKLNLNKAELTNGFLQDARYLKSISSNNKKSNILMLDYILKKRVQLEQNRRRLKNLKELLHADEESIDDLTESCQTLKSKKITNNSSMFITGLNQMKTKPKSPLLGPKNNNSLLNDEFLYKDILEFKRDQARNQPNLRTLKSSSSISLLNVPNNNESLRRHGVFSRNEDFYRKSKLFDLHEKISELKLTHKGDLKSSIAKFHSQPNFIRAKTGKGKTSRSLYSIHNPQNESLTFDHQLHRSQSGKMRTINTSLLNNSSMMNSTTIQIQKLKKFLKPKSKLKDQDASSLIGSVLESGRLGKNIEDNIQKGMELFKSNLNDSVKNIPDLKFDTKKRVHEQKLITNIMNERITNFNESTIDREKLEQFNIVPKIRNDIAFSHRNILVKHFNYDFKKDKDIFFKLDAKPLTSQFKKAHKNHERIIKMAYENKNDHVRLKRKLTTLLNSKNK
jgi:hypothetical protein